MDDVASPKPVIGITPDLTDEGYRLSRQYADMVEQTGGTPVILACKAGCIPEYLRLCDGFILSGGDDPDMTPWGVQTHPKAKPIHIDRQLFELALLQSVDDEPHVPILGICLGMQLMGLHAHGQLDQYLPDTLPTADRHWNKRVHEVSGELGSGSVHSHHRQALSEAGDLQVIATAADGVIEAVQDKSRSFYLGIQWHPERTENPELGIGLIQQLVNAALTGCETVPVS